ncbi:MAG: hypothetical protein AB7K09_01215 [Planctomycetota bacterium]
MSAPATWTSAPHVVQVVPESNRVVLYGFESRVFFSLTPVAARLIESVDPPEADDAEGREAWQELAYLGLIVGPQGDAGRPAKPDMWMHVRPMRAQLATPLQTPFDPSDPDAWEVPPAEAS